jgi:hypothetical protein
MMMNERVLLIWRVDGDGKWKNEVVIEKLTRFGDVGLPTFGKLIQRRQDIWAAAQECFNFSHPNSYSIPLRLNLS